MRRGTARALLLAALLAGAPGLVGCTAGRSGLYDWPGYERGLAEQLLEHDAAAAEASYARALTEIEQRQGRVPPGLYGDYGFLLYLRGDYTGAIAAFEREKTLFVEATPLMDRLIARVRERQGSATPAAGIPAPTPPYSSPDSRPPSEPPQPTP